MRAILAAAVLALSSAAASGPADAQDVLRGQALAERWCANCHVVTRTAATARSDGLPTFPALAARKDVTAATLKGAMSASHSRMPDLQLGARDQDDLVAYIFSLRGR
ncbi:cytochrome c [Reyranella sp.]|uniref:cytochrome c n=1 Tax=Reyranella sp. TaxID=1929291 RepID=UPI003BACA77C